MSPHRPTIMGTRHAVASGHYAATLAAIEILEAGGNAVDAGVCAGLSLGVLESTYVSVAGVAPITIYLRDTQDVVTICGLGTWPKAASCELFLKHHGGTIPKGILRTIVPAAPDAWITALDRYGTMSFGEVAAAAIRFARDGFPMYQLMATTIAAAAQDIRVWPSSAAIYLPGGAPPDVGRLFIQGDLARTLQYLADEEAAAAWRGRSAGLQAARDAFYRGDIAAAIVAFHRDNGGLMTMDDLREFRVDIEPAVRGRYSDIDVYGCGPWCQGPMLQQQLAILDGIDLGRLGHNTPAYIHTVTEAIKLAAADREAYYGDPRFVDVPLQHLLSRHYAGERRVLIDHDRAFPDMPPSGSFRMPLAKRAGNQDAQPGGRGLELDTSYVCVVDRKGNAISATPSDAATASPVVPHTGFVASSRGAQSWVQRDHPSSVMPGKRPRLTPNPAIAIREGHFVMPFGSPGHDSQTQVMLQAFLNVFAFGMELQSAVEAPRFCSLSFPSSAAPHQSHPGRLLVEDPTYSSVGDELARLGHKVERWPDDGPEYFQNLSAVCAILADTTSGVLRAAADPRRPAYAIAW